ncbi:MAG TPA: hypothetical protein VF311_10655, partial [Terriglobales bacterium]
NRPAANGRVSSARRLLFGGKVGGKAGASTLRHLLGKLAHGLLRDRAPFAAGKRGFRLIDGGQDFRAATFPLLPQRKRFLHRVFLASKPPTVNRLPDKRPLVRSELHVHMP